MKIELTGTLEFRTIALIARITLTALEHYAAREDGEVARAAIEEIRKELRAIGLESEE